MANITPLGTFYPRRLSEYVPAMTYCADINLGGDMRISFGAPALGVTTYFMSGQSIAAAGTLQASSMLNSAMLDAPFGRTCSIILSGAGTGNVTIDGWDYLNQPMSENIAMNGAAAVQGLKAFKWIRQVTWTLVSATTLNVGQGNKLGLPYKAIKAWTEENNSAPVAVGTLVIPVLTVPATATTGDTRGVYTPTTAMDGTTVFTATFAFANDVDASNNGGLMGVPHFAN